MEKTLKENDIKLAMKNMENNNYHNKIVSNT